MKRLVLVSLLLTVTAVMMPLLFMGGQAVEEPGESDPSESEDVSGGQAYAPEKDSETVITVLRYDEVTETTMAEYLPFVLAAEMPADFGEEALKAQAVAARTYILYCKEHGKAAHPDADVCCDSSCCLAYKDEMELRAAWGADYDSNMAVIEQAVEATDGQILEYDGEPILAAFHSSSAGKTEDGTELWGDIPYLTSVASPESADDVPNFVTTVEVSADEFRETLLAAFPDLTFSDDASGWASDAELDESGRVRSLTVCSQQISGSDMRSLFSLRSTAFGLSYDNGVFVFTVTGYGHGLGMSQYGANVMALKGFTYKEILKHYYSGAELV